MKIASIPDGTRDGTLVVVSRDLSRAVRASQAAPTLQTALDYWGDVEPCLRAVARGLESGEAADVFPFDPRAACAPLPRAYAFLDGSAFIHHVELVRRARGAEVPPSLYTDPLLYQGCSDPFLAAAEPIRHASEELGIDFESEVCVVVDDVPQGASAQDAAGHIKLIGLCNDVTLRNVVPGELAKGFGFLQSKPPSALSPVLVTPDELGSAWRDGRVHLPLCTSLNHEKFGDPDAGPEMHFSFPQLIAHAAKTRPLHAGTVVGSGTVSNRDRRRGSSCIVERRTLEQLDGGEPRTSYLRFGDRVRIEMFLDGASVFGAIDQVVERLEG